MAAKVSSSQILSLRDEVGLLRQILEEIWNRCEDANDLIMMSGRISDLTVKLEKLVKSCHLIEKSTNQLIDRTTLIQLANMFTDVISDYVEDSDKTEIGLKLVEAIMTVTDERYIEQTLG